MTMVTRGIGGVMMAYSVLYLAQYLFSPLYDNPQRVWDVMNVVSAVGIVAALAANLGRARSQPGSESTTLSRLGDYALLYANAALAVWFFHNWILLLTMEEGESVSAPTEVVWQLIGVMIPLTLATTGWRLWRGTPPAGG